MARRSTHVTELLDVNSWCTVVNCMSTVYIKWLFLQSNTSLVLSRRRYFLEQDTLPTLFSAGWFKEQI